MSRCKTWRSSATYKKFRKPCGIFRFTYRWLPMKRQLISENRLLAKINARFDSSRKCQGYMVSSLMRVDSDRAGCNWSIAAISGPYCSEDAGGCEVEKIINTFKNRYLFVEWPVVSKLWHREHTIQMEQRSRVVHDCIYCLPAFVLRQFKLAFSGYVLWVFIQRLEPGEVGFVISECKCASGEGCASTNHFMRSFINLATISFTQNFADSDPHQVMRSILARVWITGSDLCAAVSQPICSNVRLGLCLNATFNQKRLSPLELSLWFDWLPDPDSNQGPID